MPEFDPTNLLWERRWRGALPVTANCVGDDGAALLLVPDELAARTYQVLRVSRDGVPTELGTLSVETLHEYLAWPDGAWIVGRTADDLYLFNRGRKSRFMNERRVAFTSAALARESTALTCSFSDMLFSSHAVALGDTEGRLAWTKDQEREVRAVGITADGAALVCGRDDGALLAYDAARGELWRTLIDSPIAALALAASGPRCVAGADSGDVAMVGADGEIVWRCALGDPVLALAADAELRWTLVLTGESSTGLLTALGGGGQILWQRDLQRGPLGLAVAPNGSHFVLSLAGGYFEAYSADFAVLESGARAAAVGDTLRDARELIDLGDPAGARELLLPILAERPAHAEVAAALRDATVAAAGQHRLEASAHTAAGSPESALAALVQARELLPFDADLFAEQHRAWQQAKSALGERATESLAAGEPAAAIAALMAVTRLDPLDAQVRVRLAAASAARAVQLLAEGEQHAAANDLEGAVAAWEEAAALSPDAATETRLRQGQLELALRIGRGLYERERYPEASFYFRRVLALAPDHGEAQRLLGYCQAGGQRSLIEDRFSRLE